MILSMRIPFIRQEKNEILCISNAVSHFFGLKDRKRILYQYPKIYE